MQNIIYTNKDSFDQKLANMKEDGVKKLHVLADFDRTLTKCFVDGESRPSLIGAMRQGGYLGEEYSKKAYELFDYYHAIEIDPNIYMEIKKKEMLDWWKKHLKLLIESDLHKKIIDSVVNSGILELRGEINEFIGFLEKNIIPLVIISANGLGGDSIKLYLKENNLLKSNIYVISNEFIWDENDKATGYKEPIIHVFNKDETIIGEFPEINSLVKERKNVILLGDSLGDHHMVDGFDYENLICIGFLNEKEDELLEEYKSRYDVVLTGDPDMNFVNNLLISILGK